MASMAGMQSGAELRARVEAAFKDSEDTVVFAAKVGSLNPKSLRGQEGRHRPV